jgi:hypothetical protein
MIVLADVPFFDAFTHAKSLSKNSNLSYWSPGEPMPIISSDIFSIEDQSDVCLVCNIKNLEDFENCVFLNKSYKFLFLWNSDFDKAKQYFTKNAVEFKSVSIPKYIDLKHSILESTDIEKEIASNLVKQIESTPLSERLSRDFVSNILHKINVVYCQNNNSCHAADLSLGVPASSLDMTNAFCKSESDFINFCYYYFSNSKQVNTQMSMWVHTVSKFLISNGDTSHLINKTNLGFSSKLTEMIYQKLKGFIKLEDCMFCSLCWSYIARMKTFENSLLSIVYVRAAITGKVNKKQSINLIRNLHEQE